MKRAEQLLIDTLKKYKLTIAFVESMTCGLLTYKVGSVKDTSEVLRGSIVCYDVQVKTELLKINKSLIKKYTAESKEITALLAKKLSKLIRANIHAAITGLATSGGSESKSKPIGTVFFSVLYRRKLYNAKKRFYGSPLKIKNKACKELMKFILKVIKVKRNNK
jgi:nicotinamide-nucleotide amidase